MATVQDTAPWKNKAVSKVSAVSRGGNSTDKVVVFSWSEAPLLPWKHRHLLQHRFTSKTHGVGSMTVDDTPVPGLYHVRDFIEESELNPVKKTYGFKGVGRRAPFLSERTGELLLPGAYHYTDSTQEVLKRQMTYSFKNCPRPDISTLGVRDKDVHTSPCDYDMTAKPVEKIPCKHVMFRSTVQRISFLPKTPGPGAYEPFWKLGDRLNTDDLDPSFSLFFRNVP